ncbi:MAG: glycosyltransferase family 4 protein [Acidobacteriota bacterium]|nr:glycosyltransferase family 4 protein [Acidobacteriota bacterium]
MTRPVPVMLMVRELGPGGTERQITEIAKALDRSRFEAHVGCFHEGIRSRELREAGIPVVRLPVSSFLSPGALGGARQMGRYLHQHGIRMVHTFDYPLNCFGVPVAKLCRTPVVLSSQRADRALNPPRYNRVLRMTDRMVDGIVVNCDAIRRHLINDEGVPEKLIRLCPNGVDTQVFRAVPQPPSDTLTVGAVSVLRPEKGLDTLIRAIARVPAVRLVIAGSGPELPALASLAQQLGISERIAFEPSLTDVAGRLESIDIFVLPSLSEALSNSLMEAMACGCAVVASHVGGNPELVTDGETGLLFERANPEDLAAKLQMLIEQPALRRRLADSASRRMRDEFSIAASASRMSAIYDEFLSRKQPPTIEK